MIVKNIYILIVITHLRVNNVNNSFICLNDEVDIRRVTDALFIRFEHPQQDCERLSSARSSCTTSSRLSSRRVPGMQTASFYPLHASEYMCRGQVSWILVLIFSDGHHPSTGHDDHNPFIPSNLTTAQIEQKVT